jgi:hypothetical protein
MHKQPASNIEISSLLAPADGFMTSANTNLLSGLALLKDIMAILAVGSSAALCGIQCRVPEICD